MSVRLAIDAMGGDHGLTVTVPAALSFLQSHPDAELLLVGRPDEVEGALQSSRQAGGHGSDPALSSRIRVVPASEVIRMDDNPVQALRNRRNSSMRIAIEQVKAGEADACVSAGNTGALMAISRFVLKTLPGIDRPAIATVSKRDFSGMGRWLFVGMIVILLAAFANIFLQIPALMLTISLLATVVFSLFILFDLNRVVTGGETNYVMATLSVYINLYNVFSNLLALFGIAGGNND